MYLILVESSAFLFLGRDGAMPDEHGGCHGMVPGLMSLVCGWGTGDAPAQALQLGVGTADAALEEVRPYLMADGGNVTVVAVEAGVVYLRLEVRPLISPQRFPALPCQHMGPPFCQGAQPVRTQDIVTGSGTGRGHRCKRTSWQGP